MPVAGLLVGTIGLSYVLAPRLAERAPGQTRTAALANGAARAPARIHPRTLSAAEPWAREFSWSLGLAIPILAIATLVVPEDFDRLDNATGVAAMASLFGLSGALVLAIWTPALRAFRALPISTSRLTVLVLGLAGCVFTGGVVSAGILVFVVPDAGAWLGPFVWLGSLVFGATVIYQGMLFINGVVRVSAQIMAMLIAFPFAIVVVAALLSLRGASGFVWILVGAGVALCALGFVMLRAAISREGSLYRVRGLGAR